MISTELIGIIGGFLFMAKIIVHWYLLYSITGEAQTMSRYGLESFKYALPILQRVDEKHKPLKLIANVLYCLSLALIIFYIIRY
jgi:hypothetical protein